MIKDKDLLVEYIEFALGDDRISSMLERQEMEKSGFFRKSDNIMPALYEKMLKLVADNPEKIEDIGYIFKMVTDRDIVPDELRILYNTFCNTLKIRR